MEKQFKQSTPQIILNFVLFFVFIKASSPVVVLTAFLILCGYGISTFVYIASMEHEQSKRGNKRPLSQVIITLLLQILIVAIIGLVVWIFLYKKLDLFKGL